MACRTRYHSHSPLFEVHNKCSAACSHFSIRHTMTGSITFFYSWRFNKLQRDITVVFKALKHLSGDGNGHVGCGRLICQCPEMKIQYLVGNLDKTYNIMKPDSVTVLLYPLSYSGCKICKICKALSTLTYHLSQSGHIYVIPDDTKSSCIHFFNVC